MAIRSMIVCLVVCVLGACATLQKQRCNPEFARQQGYADAMGGMATKPSLALGQVCQGEAYSPNTFEKDYLAGYEQRRGEICSMEAARQMGPKTETGVSRVGPPFESCRCARMM